MGVSGLTLKVKVALVPVHGGAGEVLAVAVRVYVALTVAFAAIFTFIVLLGCPGMLFKVTPVAVLGTAVRVHVVVFADPLRPR
jgi:hypothetical protein